MQALIVSLLMAMNGSAQAAENLVLEAHVARHHGREETKIYRDGKNWRCVTEFSKNFPLAGKPSALALFPAKKAEEYENCANKTDLVLRSEGNARRWKGCAEDAAEFLKKLGKECGR